MAIQTRIEHLLIDPTTEPVVPAFRMAPRLDDLGDKRVGLMDNSKKNAKELLDEFVDILRERYGVASIEYHKKPSASKPAEPDVIQKMTEACDYVIVAIGS